MGDDNKKVIRIHSDFDFAADARRNRLLEKLKRQYEPGPMRPRLCLVYEEGGIMLEQPKLAWEFYAGMGDTALHDLQPEEAQTAQELLQSGKIVPCGTDTIYGQTNFFVIKHFDDVNWGKLQNGELIIYEMAHHTNFPDTIIHPGPMQEAAVNVLAHRMEYADFADISYSDPIRLRSGEVIQPIITDRNVSAMLQRRQDFLQQNLG